MRLTFLGGSSRFFDVLRSGGLQPWAPGTPIQFSDSQGRRVELITQQVAYDAQSQPVDGRISILEFFSSDGSLEARIEDVDWSLSTLIAASTAPSVDWPEMMRDLLATSKSVEVVSRSQTDFDFQASFGAIVESLPRSVSFSGGGGNDRAVGSAIGDVMKGRAGNDVLKGHNGFDKLNGGNGEDTLRGGSGKDTLVGGGGHDFLSGDEGRDLVKGGTGNDRIFGKAGSDRLFGDSGKDQIWGGNGRDRIVGGRGEDTLFGGRQSDFLSGGRSDDSVSGMSGNDLLIGGLGSDTLDGGTGRDTIVGGVGGDSIWGWAGNDFLYGDSGDDTLRGGLGNDLLRGGWGGDSLIGGDGDDTISGYSGNDYYEGGLGADHFVLHHVGSEYRASNEYWGFNHLQGVFGADGHDTISHFDEDDTLTIGSSSYSAESLREMIRDNRTHDGSEIWIETGQGNLGTDTIIHYNIQRVVVLNGSTATGQHQYLSSVTLSSFGTDTPGSGGGGHEDRVVGVAGNFQGFKLTGVLPNVGLNSGGILHGDFNNDGYSDLILHDIREVNKVHVVYGASSLPDTIAVGEGGESFTVALEASDPLAIFNFTSAVDDLNGDDRSDLVLGVSSLLGVGAVFTYTGNMDISLNEFTEQGASFLESSSMSLGLLGNTGASLGDINGDGRGDFFVTDILRAASDTEFDHPFGYIVTDPSVGEIREIEAGNGGFVVDAGLELFPGLNAAGLGDVNGDGLDDMVVALSDAAARTERAFVIHGKEGGSAVKLGKGFSEGGFEIVSHHAYESDLELALGSGMQLSGGGDFNGDGLNDIFWGLPYAGSPQAHNVGRVYVVFGSAEVESVSLGNLDDRGVEIVGIDAETRIGSSISFLGDVNGDGLDDFAVTGADTEVGRALGVFVILGTKSKEKIYLSDIANGDGGFLIIPEDETTEPLVNSTAAAAGDMNNDGFDDIRVMLSDAQDYVIYGSDLF